MSGTCSTISSSDRRAHTLTVPNNHPVMPHHVIVPLEELAHVANQNLINCKECKIGELSLVHVATLGVASNLKIYCKNCKTIYTNLLRQRSRIKHLMTNKSERYGAQTKKN